MPLIANWKGVAPEGKVLNDLTDFSDLYPTFAEIAGVNMPQTMTFDGQSSARQIHGQPGKPREWIYVQLGARWYVRSQILEIDAKWQSIRYEGRAIRREASCH